MDEPGCWQGVTLSERSELVSALAVTAQSRQWPARRQRRADGNAAHRHAGDASATGFRHPEAPEARAPLIGRSSIARK